jgi:hypothetical protein
MIGTDVSAHKITLGAAAVEVITLLDSLRLSRRDATEEFFRILLQPILTDATIDTPRRLNYLLSK